MQKTKRRSLKKVGKYQGKVEKSHSTSAAHSRKSYRKRIVLTMQHGAGKVTRRTQRKVVLTVPHEKTSKQVTLFKDKGMYASVV